MIEIFMRTVRDENLIRVNNIQEGCWINIENPTNFEINEMSERLNIQKDWFNSCIDLDEKSRVEQDNDEILIIVRVPFIDKDGDVITMPVGIISTRKVILTVSTHSNFVTEDMKSGKIKFYTTQKTRFFLKFFERMNYYYDKMIDELERKAENIEKLLQKSQSNREILELLNLQKVLIYFSSAIIANQTVFDKISTGKVLKLYEEDKGLVDDIILTNKEVSESIRILRDVLSNTLDAYASIISNNLNIVMKFLTSVSIIISIPAFIAALYGMNVKLPFSENIYAFYLVLLASFFVSILLYLLFKKRNWI